VTKKGILLATNMKESGEFSVDAWPCTNCQRGNEAVRQDEDWGFALLPKVRCIKKSPGQFKETLWRRPSLAWLNSSLLSSLGAETVQNRRSESLSQRDA